MHFTFPDFLKKFPEKTEKYIIKNICEVDYSPYPFMQINQIDTDSYKKDLNNIQVIGDYSDKTNNEDLAVLVSANDFIANIPKVPILEHENSKSLLEPYDFCINYLRKTLGGSFPFIFTGMYTGSRKRFLKEQQRKYFFENDKPIDKGTLVNAQIINVNRSTLLVEAAGVESLIDVREIAPYRVPNLKLLYSPGDFIKVYVKELIVDRENRRIKKITLSKKIADKEFYEKKIENLKKNDLFYGQIFKILDDKILVWLKTGITVMVNYRPDNIKVNDHVALKITHIDRDNIHIFGSLI